MCQRRKLKKKIEGGVSGDTGIQIRGATRGIHMFTWWHELSLWYCQVTFTLVHLIR